MKFKRNINGKDKMFVQLKDIVFLGAIPDYVASELLEVEYHQDCFLTFEKEESIHFFESREEIIDYDTVCKLSDDEIHLKINKLYGDLVHYAELCNEFEISSLRYRIATLQNYQLSRKLDIQKKSCLDCALEHSPIPFVCSGCNESFPKNYLNFVPFTVLEPQVESELVSQEGYTNVKIRID